MNRIFWTLTLCTKIRKLLRGGREDLGGHVGRGVRPGAGGGGHEGVGGRAAEEGEGQVQWMSDIRAII